MSPGFNRFSRKLKSGDIKLNLPGQEKQKSKYGNKKVEYDGHKFDSKKECDYYIELKQLEKEGKISDIKCQVVFLLQDKFKDKTGKTHLKIEYIADFTYVRKDTGDTMVLDVKASAKFQDPVYKLKKKLLLFRYPELNFKEVY